MDHLLDYLAFGAGLEFLNSLLEFFEDGLLVILYALLLRSEWPCSDLLDLNVYIMALVILDLDGSVVDAADLAFRFDDFSWHWLWLWLCHWNLVLA